MRYLISSIEINGISQEIIKLFLVDEYLSAGFYSKPVTLNSKFPSGVYFYQLQVGNLVQSKKIILIK